MRRSLVGALVLASSGLAASCGQGDPASLVGLEIWEGYVVEGQAFLGSQAVQEADGTFLLKRDALYVAYVTVRTSGKADRCLFRPFYYSWFTPNRIFDCYPETHDGPMTIQVPFSTHTHQLARVSEYYVLAQVREHVPDQQDSFPPIVREYPVRFVE